MEELLDDFIAETRETLQAIEGELIAWERDPGDRAMLDGIFRFVHTVKGSCGFLDLPRLTRLSHAAEDALDAVRQGEIEPSSRFVSAVLAIVDRIAAITEALETEDAVFDDDAELIDTLEQLRSGDDANLSDAGQAAEPDRERRSDSRAGSSRNRSVRLSLDLLDHLMSGVSDMVLARNEMARRLRDQDSGVEIDQLFSRLSASIAEMRDTIGLVRLQPIDRLFVSFPRLVRDIARDLGKDIVLEIEGGDVEIDREMVEFVRDPLMHILRNAVDHGIESAEERAALGKPACAVIRLAAQQSGNQIVIEVSDDGRGIDVDRIVAKAIAKNITTADKVARMTRREKLDLIFAAGLTTASEVTDLSGRGVGMDIVHHSIEQMGGSIELRNDFGRGLAVVLRLPLTLSIMPGLSIRVGDRLFAMPRSAIVEILSMRGGQVRIDETGGAEIAAIRGARMTFVRLDQVLGHEMSEPPQTVIVVRPAAGRRYALGVSAVVDHEELVVKPAPPLLMASGIYAGLSLPDSGRPIMLLDAAGIAEVAQASDRFEEAKSSADELVSHRVSRALLFQCLHGARKAIRLSVLDRMEEVPSAAIRDCGGAMRLAHNGRRGVVLGLKDAPAGPATKLLRLTDGRQDVYIAVEDMLDIIDLPQISPAIAGTMIEGIVEYEGEQIELIDAHAFLAEGAKLSGTMADAQSPLCYVERDAAGWMANVLRPLLEAAGYRVTHDPNDRDASAAELLPEESAGQAVDRRRAVLLHDAPGIEGDGSVYRYDRGAILAALETRISDRDRCSPHVKEGQAA